mmetsp:Transcript_11315/g.17108  ORF Transcript_11315/g.17108 Transcript_11315/m.17108 type:complete len:103 (-) Transcript_11315:202-510(-)
MVDVDNTGEICVVHREVLQALWKHAEISPSFEFACAHEKLPQAGRKTPEIDSGADNEFNERYSDSSTLGSFVRSTAPSNWFFCSFSCKRVGGTIFEDSQSSV